VFEGRTQIHYVKVTFVLKNNGARFDFFSPHERNKKAVDAEMKCSSDVWEIL
jgi:hypothetical protein